MLIVHRSTSGAQLARALADVLAEPARDPFTAEVVALPAKGVERWLAQRLSHVLGACAGDGVCANVDFPRPDLLVEQAVRAASPQHAMSIDRWAPERVRWPLVEVIDAARTEPWCRFLAHHLDSGGDGSGRRLALGSRLARMFHEYDQGRPTMLQAWARGLDEFGDGRPLDIDLVWQARLWRRLRDHLAVPSPAEVLDDVCRRLRADPGLSTLPARFSVFGASRLPVAGVRVIAALAEHRDIHVWLHHSSPALWDAVQHSPAPVRRADDSVRKGLRNPLLASMSRDLLELQQVLRHHAPTAHDVLHEAPDHGISLLGRLKQDLADDRVPVRPAPLDPADRSVQVHACHGRTRQVEVLREAVVGLLASDPTLEPRDVLVMCPDIETFAPLISAAFSIGGEDAQHPADRLRVRLADRGLRQTNALAEVLARLIDLGTGRITASQVLDLAGRPAVRRRFGFDDDDVERMREWVAGAGIRWGLDGGHRAGWHLGDIAQGTWRAGLDRLLLGAAVQDELTLVGDVVPLDDVDSADIDLVGRLAEFVDRLDAAQTLMSGRHTMPWWISGLEAAVLELTASTWDTAWQESQLHQQLADLSEGSQGSPGLFDLAEVRGVLAQALAGRPTRAGFRTGGMTICTLVPMRSVPHRVVCLLGLDDGTFPRQSIRDGDDVLARDPWVGDRDPRSEDRQLLLDAIGAARDHLLITYAGADPRTGTVIPPAVPLGEVLDALDRTASAPEGLRIRDVITVRHPLQPFDPRNFTPGRLGTPGPFSFDRAALAGARAADGPRSSPPPFLDGPLPEQPARDVELTDLQRLLQHPVRGFLRQRLQVATTWEREEPQDALPVALDPLQEWAVGERLLAERIGGLEPAECLALELRRGLLPPGPVGEAVAATLGRRVEAVVSASVQDRGHPAVSRDVDVALPDGTRLVGTVDGVRADVLLSTTYSRLGPRHRLEAWIQLLALTASDPSRPWVAVAVGRGRDAAARSVLGPVGAQDAAATVWDLVQLYRAGLRRPLPLPLKTAAAYAAQREHGRRVPAARTAAASMWTTRPGSGSVPGENADAEHVLLFGADADLTVLTDQLVDPDQDDPSRSHDESDLFGLLARRVWGRLLGAERLVAR